MRTSPSLAALALLALLAAACGDDASSEDGATTPGGGTGATTTTTTGTGGAGGGATTTTASGGAGGGATTTTASGGAGGAGGATTTTGSGGAGGGCGRVTPAGDHARRLVFARPYDTKGGKASRWEVLDLGVDGGLARPGVTFEMGRGVYGEVAFTPDGQVALAAQEDGTLGVVRFADDGTPTVVHAAFQGSFYAEKVVVLPGGDRAIVVDPNWRNNGGGLYAIAIGCDGTITDLGLLAPSKLAAGMALLPGGKALLAAADVLASKAGDSAHLLDLSGAAPALLGGADAFGDEEAIVASVAVTHDGKFGLVGDNSEFSGIPNRVAVVGIGAGALSSAQVLTPVGDPVAIVTSPFDDAALVVSGYDNAFYRLAYDPTKAAPFTFEGELDYVGKAPELPSAAALVATGSLEGSVYVAELAGIRRARFAGGGVVEDLGKFDLGDGMDQITGSMGVSP
jgi:hypothetical protein